MPLHIEQTNVSAAYVNIKNIFDQLFATSDTIYVNTYTNSLFANNQINKAINELNIHVLITPYDVFTNTFKFVTPAPFTPYFDTSTSISKSAILKFLTTTTLNEFATHNINDMPTIAQLNTGSVDDRRAINLLTIMMLQTKKNQILSKDNLLQ